MESLSNPVVKTLENASAQDKVGLAQAMDREECKICIFYSLWISLITLDLFSEFIEKDKNTDEEDEDNDIMSHLNYRKL